MEHFKDGQAQDVPVHGGNAVQFPILCVLLDNVVGFLTMLDRAANSGSANTRMAASSTLGGGNSMGWPQVAAPFSSAMAAARCESQNSASAESMSCGGFRSC